MATVNITGSVSSVTGTAAAGARLTINPVLPGWSNGEALILGEPFVVTADGSGDVDFDVEPGDYRVQFQLSTGEKVVGMSVGSDGPYDLAEVINTTTAQTLTTIMQTVLAYKIAAEEAAELSQAWAEGTEPGGPGTQSSREWAQAGVDPTYYPVFPDDPLYSRASQLVVDESGRVVLDTDPTLQTYPIFPDDPLYPYNLIVDADGRVLVKSITAPPESYADWQAAVLADGNVWALSPTRSVKLSDPAGTAYGGQVRDERAFWVDGTSYRTMRLDALDDLPATVTKLVFVPIIGQSLLVGTSNVASLLSTTAMARVYAFNGGPLPIQTAAKTTPPTGLAAIIDSQMESVIPLVERVDGPLSYYGETPLSGMGYSLAAERPASEAFLLASFGVGSTTISQLGATSEPFKNMIRGVERAKAFADMRGLTFDCPGFGWLQGEGDISASTAPATYEAALLAIQAAFKSAVDAICGATADRPAILLQPASAAYYNKANTLPAAMLDMALDNPSEVRIAGALYHLPHYDSAGVHMLALGYRKLGEEWGRAVAGVMAGTGTGAIYATAASNSGTTLTITTNAATQLVLDDATVTDPGQKGIRLRKVSDQSLVALSSIAVSGTDQITATMAGTLSAAEDYQVEIGQNLASLSAGILSGPTTGYRACFRDSSTDEYSALAGGADMHRWLAYQTLPFTAS